MNQFSLSAAGSGGYQSLANGSLERNSDTQVTISGLQPVSIAGSGQCIIVTAAAQAIRAGRINVKSEKSLQWTAVSQNPFADSIIHSIAYGAGKYLAVGDGKIAQSADGQTWTEITGVEKDKWYSSSSDYVIFRSIAFGAGTAVVAVGYWVSGWGVAAVSTDSGATWTVNDHILSDSNPSPGVFSVSYGGGKFVAVGSSGTSAYSTDGSVWTKVRISPFGYLDNVNYFEDAYSVAFGDGKFLVAGKNGKAAYTDAAAIDWKWVGNSLLGSLVDVNTVCFGGGMFLAAGNAGAIRSVNAASLVEGGEEDGGANWIWTDAKFNGSGILSLAYGDGKFLAVGHDGKASISEDTRTWTAIPSGAGALQNKFGDREQILAAVYGTRFILAGNSYSSQPTAKIVYGP
jgi:hypothetical protein